MECFSRRTHIHIWSTSLSIEIDYISTIFSLSLSLSLSKQNKRQSNVLCEVVTWEVFRCPLTFFWPPCTLLSPTSKKQFCAFTSTHPIWIVFHKPFYKLNASPPSFESCDGCRIIKFSLLKLLTWSILNTKYIPIVWNYISDYKPTGKESQTFVLMTLIPKIHN